MAEERLIDDDKDRKYKIRKNADGEEELVIDETEEEEELPVFAMPEYETDDEEAASLTPEQLAERERLKAEEEQARKERLKSLLDTAEEKLAAGDFEGANYAVVQAEEINADDGRLCCLKLKILTRDMTEFSDLGRCAEAADGVKEHASEEQRAYFAERSEKFKSLYSETEKKTEALHAENERKKEERRGTLLKERNRSLIWLLCPIIPLIVFISLAISFSGEMFEETADMITTIVFVALALVAFVFTVIGLKKFWAAARDVKLNERDSSTKLGREYSEYKNRLDLLKRIYDIL